MSDEKLEWLADTDAEVGRKLGGTGPDARGTLEWALYMGGVMLLRAAALKGGKLTKGNPLTLTQNVDFTLPASAADDPIMARLAGRRFKIAILAKIEPVS